MAAKGDRERLEPVARMLYCDGKSLTAIEEILDVSRQTLTAWRDRGDWDKAKAAKDNYEADLVSMRDAIVEKIKSGVLPTSADLDALAKVDAIIDRRAKAVREASETLARQKGEMFLTIVRDLIEFSRVDAPELCAALQEHFDDLMQYGREKYAS